ncbi:hypothetical protein GCM10007977_001310 [Dactylosporangium sucinum]|uniref:Uncharacterized protein n=1 Tax=Dactylosporangium sucinum TaxID=1424081 RepID=A0A917SYF4_9ACTN|nr:hypothetical protein GCM10007977_001310 [Dactylosporangium sucinum]
MLTQEHDPVAEPEPARLAPIQGGGTAGTGGDDPRRAGVARELHGIVRGRDDPDRPALQPAQLGRQPGRVCAAGCGGVGRVGRAPLPRAAHDQDDHLLPGPRR